MKFWNTNPIFRFRTIARWSAERRAAVTTGREALAQERAYQVALAGTVKNLKDEREYQAAVNQQKKEAALAMVRHCEGNKTAAASALGISRARLYRLIGEAEE